MKELLLMAVKQIPDDKISSMKSGLIEIMHQLAYAQKIDVKLEQDEDDVVVMGVLTRKEIVICPVTVNYSGGVTSIKRELDELGFSATKFIDKVDIPAIIDAISEKNELKQSQTIIDVLSRAKKESGIVSKEDNSDVEELTIEGNGDNSESGN